MRMSNYQFNVVVALVTIAFLLWPRRPRPPRPPFPTKRRGTLIIVFGAPTPIERRQVVIRNSNPLPLGMQLLVVLASKGPNNEDEPIEAGKTTVEVVNQSDYPEVQTMLVPASGAAAFRIVARGNVHNGSPKQDGSGTLVGPLQIRVKADADLTEEGTRTIEEIVEQDVVKQFADHFTGTFGEPEPIPA